MSILWIVRSISFFNTTCRNQGHSVVDYGQQSITAHDFDDDFEYDNDNEFKPVDTTLRRENTPASDSQKKHEGKEKTTNSTGNSDNITFDYGSDDFMESMVPYVSSKSRSSDKQGSNEDPLFKKIMAVKTTVNIIWKREYLKLLHELVDTLFARIGTFSVQDFIKKEFFVEVFLSLIVIAFLHSGRFKDTTKYFRCIIEKYKEAYIRDAGHTPMKLPYAQQIAKENAKSVCEEMQAKGPTDKEIKEAIRSQAYVPCNEMKSDVSKNVCSWCA
ncbi:hypothetical protein EDC94DRAFT_652540 [Helicostylum pulchrum]|nr:hypothetical protein EDC94DRAFT_652540 [Helicostylum pulchrum]